MRRGVAIFVVLLVIAAGASVAVSVLAQGFAAQRSAQLADDRVQARSAAWSAVQILMSKIHGQREALFAGGAIEVPAVIELWGGSGAGRMMAFVKGPGVAEQSGSSDGDSGELAAKERLAESAKLALNRADAAMLIKIGMREEEANAVVARRRARAFGSVEELATVPGIAVTELMEGKRGDLAEEGTASAAWVEWLTVQSYEPAMRMTAWGEGKQGDPRVDARRALPAAFLKDLEAEVGKAVSDRVVKAARTARAGLTRSKFVAVLKSQGVPKASWGRVLDAVTFGDDAFVPGLVDLNRASAAVLACVPGISSEVAAAIVKAREEIDRDQRRVVTWPLDAGLMTEEEFTAAADWLSTRSLQWRYRITVGEAEGSGMDTRIRDRGRMVVDVVIDAADGRPRLAYYRDVTHLQLALLMEREVSAAAARLEAERQRLAPPPPPPPQPSSTSVPSQSPSRNSGAPKRERRDNGRTDRSKDNANSGEEEPAPSGLKDRRQGRWRTDGSGA